MNYEDPRQQTGQLSAFSAFEFRSEFHGTGFRISARQIALAEIIFVD